MANNQHAVITVQGNPNSRKCYDPSGFVVMSPSGFKTFSNLAAAVLWATKKGYAVRMSRTLKPSGRDALAVAQFNEAVEAAQVALAAPAEA